jgi:hypothetical protein
VLIDAVRDTIASTRRSDLPGLTIRSLPDDLPAVKASVDELLEQSPRGQRIGFICRSEPLAVAVEAAAEARKLIVGRNVGIVVSDVYRKSSDPAPRWPYVKASISPEEIGKHIGRMLARQSVHSMNAADARVDAEHEIIPVSLQMPQ